MTFDTRVSGIPCQCRVIRYDAGLPMRITGWGFGDADPPEPPEFDFEILDRRGRRAEWLERKLTEDDEERLLDEYLEIRDEFAA